VAVDALEAAAEANSRTTVEFWQRLMAAELTPKKCRELLVSLGTSLDVQAVLRSRLLSENERKLFQEADVGLAHSFLDQGVRLITADEYPEPLATTPLVPPALWTWGDFDLAAQPTVAIVGTRNASTYGKAVAQRFASELAAAGVVVISGGALGIDAASHRGALEAGGKTMAVLITGVDRAYPREHEQLFGLIRQQGCLVSQFPIGSTKPAWNTRPLARNQTIAALSQAVLVIEAPTKSGALTTANAANELGRQVFVVPANIDNLNFKGSHALIRDGATLVDHPAQLLEALNIESRRPEITLDGITDSQKRILAVLSMDPLASEFIVERTGMGMAEVMGELTMLELEGLVIRDAGGYARTQ